MQIPFLTFHRLILLLLILALAAGPLTAGSGVTAQGPLPYQDPALPIAERVEDLLSRMSLDEKIGQMVLIEKNSMRLGDITRYGIGALLSGGGGYPVPNTPEAWADMVGDFQAFALQTRLGIPLLYGVDSVHGHNNLWGAVIFPHNIGLGAAGDPALVERIGRATAVETAATGIYWNYAPVLAVPQDIRWGRTYEGYGEDPALVAALGAAYLRGLQGEDLAAPDTILATPKHFVGDGGTTWGTPTTAGYLLDQGITEVDEATLRAVHLAPYLDAIDAGAMSIMVSFSSWGGLKMHAQRYLLTDVLKGELGFQGFLVSDWAGISQVDDDYYQALVTAINAGIDMNMVPGNYTGVIALMRQAVQSGDISEERIDDAVRRILTVKFMLGLFEHPYPEPSLLAEIGSAEHRALAREAVARSLVLLKNDDETLPIPVQTPVILVGGVAAHDVGVQSGGWTVEWQGIVGIDLPGTSIVEGIATSASAETAIYYDPRGWFANLADSAGNPLYAPYCVAVVGEPPYAEGLGDRADLALFDYDRAMIERLRGRCERLVVVIVSGRPLIVTDDLDDWDALVAAWLPGSEGQGVADVLFGDQPFTGRLSYSWPRSMDQVPLDMLLASEEGPLFSYGFGLEYPIVEETPAPTPAD